MSIRCVSLQHVHRNISVVCRNCQHGFFLLLSVHNRHMNVSMQQNSAHERFTLSKQYFGRSCTFSSELSPYTRIQIMPSALCYFTFTRMNSETLCKVCVFITGKKIWSAHVETEHDSRGTMLEKLLFYNPPWFTVDVKSQNKCPKVDAISLQ